MPSRPSRDSIRRTKSATGSRLVRHMLTIRQSAYAITGRMSFDTVLTTNGYRSRARSTMSVCGYSL